MFNDAPRRITETTPLLSSVEETIGNNNSTTPHNNLQQQQQQQQHPTPPTPLPYHGFSTSLGSLFHSPHDCCALTCCGTLQRDRNYYLFYKTPPPSLSYRLCRHVLIPVCLIGGIFASAVMLPDEMRDGMTTCFILLLLIYIIGDGVLTRMEKVKFRQDLSWKAQGRTGVALQSKTRAMSAHRWWGCYARDDYANNNEEEREGDMMVSLWRCWRNACCGWMCGCWCVCCSICATAQEAREVELMLDEPGEGLIDYVTMEHYSEYFPVLDDLRRGGDGRLYVHWKSLSKLSMLLVKSLGGMFLVLVVLSVVDFNDGLSLDEVLVFIATFCQAFIILYLVHWKWNRFDLSLDAVVKFFASGFLLTTSLAVVFEMIESFILQIILSIIIALSGVRNDNIEPENGYDQQQHDESFQDSPNDDDNTTLVHAFGQKYPGVMVVYLMLNSFALAAFVEETCKYFGFFMVNHPDLIMERDQQQLCLTNRRNDVTATRVDNMRRRHGNGGSTGDSLTDDNGVVSGYNSPNVIQGQCQRSMTSIGAGITIAMVSVALGFACCENLIYIFVYTKGGLKNEIFVLIARSLFPVHPLCAAIQSIHVCRRVLENDKSCGIGWIIFPAVILHGTFDFCIMLLSFIGELQKQKQQSGGSGDDNDGESDDEETAARESWITLISLYASLFLLIGGVIYFIVESCRQRRRLKALDEATGNNSRLI